MADPSEPPDPKTCKHRFVEKEYYECEYCNKAFTTAYNLSRHKKGNCQENVCQKCHLRFQKLEQLKEHIIVCTGKQPYQCEFCGKSFLKNSNLSRHRQTHTERCELCNALFYKRIPLITLFPEEQLYKCKHCDEGFKTPELLESHFQNHYQSNSNQCEECFLGFSKRRHLTRHKQKEHPASLPPKKARKTYECPVCHRVFLKKKDRKKHLQIHIEAGIKIHSCKVCGKSYTQEKTLRMHMIKHGSDDKKPRCKVCNKMFSHPFSLRYHMRIHNNVKPCVCKICGTAFRQAGHLSRHLLTHSSVPKEHRERKHMCKTCNKGYATEMDLRHHMFVHNGEKKFSCSFCGKSFLFKRTLDHHVNTHTGQKPYKCDGCDKAFAQPGSLHKHKQTHLEIMKDGVNGASGVQMGSRTIKNIQTAQQSRSQPTVVTKRENINSMVVENMGVIQTMTSNGLIPARSMHQQPQIPQQLVISNQLQPIHNTPPVSEQNIQVPISQVQVRLPEELTSLPPRSEYRSDCLEQIALQHLQFQTAPFKPKVGMVPGAEPLGAPPAAAAYWHQPIQQPNIMHFAPPPPAPPPPQQQNHHIDRNTATVATAMFLAPPPIPAPNNQALQ